MILWVDGIDHYGTGSTGRTNMLQGAYAALDSAVTPSTTNPRTGSFALRSTSSVASNLIRRVFGSDLSTVGVGMGLYLSQLPNGNTNLGVFDFRDNANATQCSVWINSTGTVSAYRGNATSGTLLGTSSDAVVVAGAYQHVECKVTVHDSSGSVEVRVNGVTALSVSGVDTKNTAVAGTAQWAFNLGSGSGVTLDIDDLFCWDTSGSNNNDFLGDKKVYLIKPNGDTVETDWVRNTGTDDYAAIDDASPDADTTYLEATTVGDLSEFDLESVDAAVSSIACVYVAGMYKKTDAGDGSIRQSMVTGGSPNSVAQGESQPITTAYTYWDDVFETDPSTGALWTPSGFNAAKLRIERTL